MSRFYKPNLSLAALLAIGVRPYYLAATLLFSFVLYLPQRVQAQTWVNGQPASFVMGDPGFDVNNSYNINPNTLAVPSMAIVDPATGKVFVCDQFNSRVLRYPSGAEMTNGATAEAVLGQSGFNSANYPIPPSATSMSFPTGIAIDASGRLWVVDGGSRLLRFDNAANIASGSAANAVLGQPNFVSYTLANNNAATVASLYQPSSVFCSGTTVWVSDAGNNRVVRFDNAAAKANGANADAVFGAPSFVTATHGDINTAANLLATPSQIYVDGSDNLWVADANNNRVLMFPNASFTVNAANGGIGGAATLVLGQTDFVSSNSDVTATAMNYPTGVYGDAAGTIYVSDYGNSRILIFPNAATLSNDAAASYVLGQPDFVSNNTGNDADELWDPSGLFIVPGTSNVLLAADYINSRVLTYIPQQILPLQIMGFTGRLQNNGQALLQWQVSAQEWTGAGNAGTIALEYSTTSTTGFTNVLNTQSVNPAVQNYSYVQVSPAAGVNYYRVKLTAPGGLVTYSQVVTLKVGNGTSSGLSIYPNPAHSSIVVTVPQVGGSVAGRGLAGTAIIGIYNSTGMLVQQLVTGAAVNTIDISSLAPGVYTVKVVQGSSTATSSFIKVN